MAVYIYCITDDYAYQSGIKGKSFENEWLQLSEDGIITIKGTYHKGYAWDGCSPKLKIGDIYFGTLEAVLNPMTQRSKTYYASLIHDALYQFSRQLRVLVSRKEVDTEFYTLLKRDNFCYAKLYYGAVRCFGWFFWGRRA